MSLEENLENMLDPERSGMDVLIVSTSSRCQEEFWQARLEAGRGTLLRRTARVLCVEEDWPGGAGNGLGTLYALARAAEKGRNVHGIDLMKMLEAGASVALYHTAGKGTRLAPLPGSEWNNKPAVKLPGVLRLGDRRVPITILESVIRQTAVYAPARRGRVSVFWGDQVFIPSADTAVAPTHEADILARLMVMPDAAGWAALGLERYGLIAVGDEGDAAQVEKVTHATALDLVARGALRVDRGIGVSLGSFSMSHALCTALLEEFATELQDRSGKLDTDPHFWMPLTLDIETYAAILGQKGIPRASAEAHHARMARFRERFLARHPGARMFGCVDVGAGGYWWDYGTVQSYLANNLKLCDPGPESDAMRRFFGIVERHGDSTLGPGVRTCGRSVVIGCDIRSGDIAGSVLVGVVADRMSVDGSVLIEVAAPEVAARGALLYKVAEPRSLRMEPGAVRADAFVPGLGQLSLRTEVERSGQTDWDVRLPGNTFSYEELMLANQGVHLADAMQLADDTLRAVGRSSTPCP